MEMIESINLREDVDGEPYLYVSTPGCGCCSDGYRVAEKDRALQVLDEYEADLKEALKLVKEMRQLARRFKK